MNSIWKRSLAMFLSIVMVFGMLPVNAFATGVDCEHSYASEVTKEAACEDMGETTYTCELCGDVYTEEISATGHAWGEGVETAATCTEDGYTTYTCGNCGTTKTEGIIAATGHDMVDGACTVCGKPEETEDDSTEESSEAPAECNCKVKCNEQLNSACPVCGAGDITACEGEAAHEHSYQAVVTAPTCGEDGYTTYTCADETCKHTYTDDVVPATEEHDYVDGVCTVCGGAEPEAEEPSYDVDTMSDAEVAALLVKLVNAEDEDGVQALVEQLDADRLNAVIELCWDELPADEDYGTSVQAETDATVTVYKKVSYTTDTYVDGFYYELIDTDVNESGSPLENAVTALKNAGVTSDALILISGGTLVVTNRQDITISNVTIKGAGEDKTTITGDASKFNNGTDGLASNNLKSEYKALIGSSQDNVKLMDLTVDADGCGVVKTVVIFKQPADLKTIRINSGKAVLENVTISGSKTRSNLMVGTSSTEAEVVAVNVTVNDAAGGIGYSTTEIATGSKLTQEDSILGGAIVGATDDLGAGYYKATSGDITVYTTIPYAIDLYNQGVDLEILAEQDSAQGVQIAVAMASDLAGGDTMYGKDADGMYALAVAFKAALEGLSADTGVNASEALTIVEKAIAENVWGAANVPVTPPTEEEESPVVIPEEIVDTIVGDNATEEEKAAVQTFVNEIKANTALNDYAPTNVPEGAALVIKLTGMAVADSETAVAPTRIVYDVAPMQGETKVENLTEAITFRLPIPASVTESYAKVYHGEDLMDTYPIEGEDNGKYVEVTSADFSEYTVVPTNEAPAAYVAKIGEQGYETFAAAMNAANALTGDVTVEIYGEVEFVDGMELKNGGFTAINFKGMTDGAKITINQTAGGDYLEAHGKTVSFTDLILAKANPAWSGNAGHMGNYFSVQGGTVTYTRCTFPNGASTNTGTATYNSCTFENASEYGLWVYDDALVTVNGGTINSKKGIKVYSEGEESVTSTLTVEGATFTENVTEKPAVAIGYAQSITLIGNTYNNTKGVLELDSGSDADCNGITFVAQDANGNDIASTLTAVDRSNNNAACGVLVDGKIYTTVAEAAKDANAGSTVTLLHNSTEIVELAEGVILNKNNYTADGVTVVQPVAQIGDKKYTSLDTAFAEAAEGDTITLLADATPTLTSQSAITKASTIDLGGKTLTLTEDDLYFGTTTFKNGTIVVAPTVKASTAVFWMFANQTLIFDDVDIVATGVTGTYLIGINGGTGSAVMINNSSITIDNDAQADLSTVICDNGNGNSVVIENSTIDVDNIGGRFYLGGENGTITVKDSNIDLDGVKEGFYLRAGQNLSVEGTSNVDIVLNSTDGRYGINMEAASATYTKADTATVNGTVYKAPVKVTDKASLDAAIAAAQPGDVITLANDIVYGNPGLMIEKAITLDLGGHTLTTTGVQYSLALKNDGIVITNGKLNHAGTVAAIKVWNAKEISDLEIDVTGTSSVGNPIGGIVIQQNAAGVDTIKNVTIHSTAGQGIANGIETYNCGAGGNVIGTMENVTIDVVGTAMNISAPCGTATGCTFKGGENGIEIWIKGNYSASLTLEDCDVTGGVYAHDEFNSNPSTTNNGTLTLTVDDATTGVEAEDITLTIARIDAEQIEGVELNHVLENAKAKIGDTYYLTLAKAVEAAESGATITLLADEHKLPVFQNKELTFVGEDKETTSITDWVEKGNQMYGVTVHFKDLTINGRTGTGESANYYGLFHTDEVTYNNCDINGIRFLYAPATFEGCAFNANGVEHSFWTYGSSEVTVTDCTFSYTDRAVNCYSENGANHELDITFTGCTFTYTGNADAPEGAVEINSSSVKSIDLTMNGCTAPAKGEMWFISQWDGKDGANTTVIEDDEQVWPEPVAKIGETTYTALQDAIDAATAASGTYEITLLPGTIDEDVVIHQTEGVNITIKGNEKDTIFTGYIEVYGHARNQGAETLTFDGVLFQTSEASHTFIEQTCQTSTTESAAKCYPHNITVQNCSFTATDDAVNTAVGMKYRYGYNITVKDTTSHNMHSLMQNYAGVGLTVENVTITGKNGIALGTSQNVTVKNATIDATGYGLRYDAELATTNTIDGCTIEAFIPVVVRKTTADGYALNVIGENTMTATNTDGYWMVIGKEEYEKNGELPTLAKDVALNITGNVTSEQGIYGIRDYVAEVGGVKYEDFVTALKAVTAENYEVNILKDITITENWDNRYTGAKFTVPVVINGNDKTIKFEGQVSDGGNYHAAFRFEADAEVNDLTIDMSTATANGTRFRAISAKGNLTVDGCKFIGNPAVTNSRAIIFGEGERDKISELEARIIACEFTDWTKGLTDNENGGQVKLVGVNGSKFNNAKVTISAAETIHFNNNEVSDCAVDIRSYLTDTSALVVKAAGNTLDDEYVNAIINADKIETEDAFIYGTITLGYVSEPYYNGVPAVWGEATSNAKESFIIEVYAGSNKIATTTLTDLAAAGTPTWHAAFENDGDTYWSTEWTEGNPSAANKPTSVRLLIDGVKVSEKSVMMSKPDGLEPVVWEELEYFKPDVAQTKKADGTAVDTYKNFEEAIAAAAADSTITEIVVLCDSALESVENTEEYYDITGQLVITADQKVTVTGCGFAVRVMGNGASLTIAENVTIEGLDVVANGFATTGENMTIDGTLKALSLKQWTNNGTITVNKTGSVWLGYGDGQFDMAYGNGTVTITGNGDKTAAQFKAGYSGTRGNGNTLNLNETYFEAGAWFNVNGSNGTINADNALLKVSGGDGAGSMTIASSGNVINLTNGSELAVANLTIGAGNTVKLDKTSSVEATKITGAGTIVIDATDMEAGIVSTISGNASTFNGKIEVINSDDLMAGIDENGNIYLYKAVAKIDETKYASLDAALDAAKAAGMTEVEIQILDDCEFDPVKTVGFTKLTLNGTDRAQKVTYKNSTTNATTCDVTFNGLTVKNTTDWLYSYYYTARTTYKDCKLIGNYRVTTPTVFTDCDFTYEDDCKALYNVFIYGGEDVTIENCTFHSYERAIKIYNQIAVTTDLTITNTTFNSETVNKSVIEIDQDNATGINISIDDKTTATGFRAGYISTDGGNTFTEAELTHSWFAIEMDNTEKCKYNIVVDDELLYCGVAKIADKHYATLAEAVAAAQDNDTITMLANVTLDDVVTIDRAITLDLNAKTITGADGAIVLNVKADMTIKNGSIKGNKSGTSSGLIDIYADLTMEGVTVETSKINALRFKAGDCTATLTDCDVTGAFKGYGGSVWNIESGTYKASSTSINDQLNGTASVSGGTFHYEIAEEECAPGYAVVNNGNGTWTVKYAPVCFVDTNNNGVQDEGEILYGSLAAVFNLYQEGDVYIVLTDNAQVANKVDTDADAHYYLNTNVETGATVDFLYEGTDTEEAWNYVQKMTVGENVTLNVPYLLAWTEFNLYGTVNTKYFYTTVCNTTIHESAVLNANTGDATVQVKNGANMTVNGELNTSILNVWVGESKLTVSGENAKVNAKWIDIWDGTPSVVVENGATLTTETIKASRGGSITVDGATLTGAVELGHNTESAGTMTVVNEGTVIGEIKLTAQGSTVTGPKDTLTVVSGVDGYVVIYKDGVHQLAEKDVAEYNGTKYEKVADALNAARMSGGTVTVLRDCEETGYLVVPAGVILELNGCVMTADYVIAIGQIQDSADEVGGIKAAKNSVILSNNVQMPLYDVDEGCYKFFAYQTAAAKNVSADEVNKTVKFSYAMRFTNSEAYTVLADHGLESGLTVGINLKWTNIGENTKNVYSYTDAHIKAYANKMLENVGTNKVATFDYTVTNLGVISGQSLTAELVVASAGSQSNAVKSYNVP